MAQDHIFIDFRMHLGSPLVFISIALRRRIWLDCCATTDTDSGALINFSQLTLVSNDWTRTFNLPGLGIREIAP